MTRAENIKRLRALAVTVDDSTGCWVWTRKRDRTGYGQLRRPQEQRLRPAHREFYEVLVGPVPEDLDIDHLCRNRACVNPDHLEPVTRSENTLRAVRYPVTHCPHGHPYDEANARIRADGTRICVSCLSARNRRYRLKKRAAAALERSAA